MLETHRLGRGFFFAIATILITNISGLSANALTREDVKELVIIEAERQRIVPTPLALAVARVESNFQADAESHKGARGVMQIMPKTAKDVFGVSENELWGARLNIRLGLKYLTQLYHQYGRRWDLALSHYNGGTLKGHGADAVPHSYTKNYVNSVLRWASTYDRDHATQKLIQLASARDSSVAMHPKPSIYNYWNEPKPRTMKNWRFYLKTANRWLGTKKLDHDYSLGSVEIPERAYSPAAPRRSEILLKKFEERALRFRRHLLNATELNGPLGNKRFKT